MAKRNQKNQFQLLSPENYIRQKSRNLPIYDCRINCEWKEGQLASILVARSHANENITFCFYLVDLGCLGVKDSMYYFNMPIDEYKDYLEDFEENLASEPISYTLAHNIIYAGLQFAEEYGFKPCKEFTSTTKFMLEEDTDDIELIDIEVGDEDGDPLFVNNGYESPSRVNQILNQLDKYAGEGNYTYINNLNDSDDDQSKDELSKLSPQEFRDEFIRLFSKGIDKLSEAETFKLASITDEIYTAMYSFDEVENYLDSWQNELEFDLDDEYNHEVLGVDNTLVITQKLRNAISEILIQIDKKPEKAGKKIDELAKQIGNTHFIAFLRLEVMKLLSPDDITPTLNEYSKEFPQSSMLKLMVAFEQNFSNNELLKPIPTVDSIFDGRKSVTLFEMYRFWNDKLLMIANCEDINMLEAFYLFLDQIDIDEQLHEMLQSSTKLIRIFVLGRQLTK